MHKTYAEHTRSRWGCDEYQNPTLDQLKYGVLQRIADATELMAKRHADLIRERNDAERSRDYWRDEAERMTRKNNALRGVITKLKARAALKGKP